jgi:WXG100 family type VII secretion target
MSDVIAYDFTMLNAAADSCKTAVSTMMSKLDDLETTCNALKATWTGQAQEVYTQREREWSQAANDLKILLDGIGGALRESATQMQASEQRNTRAFGG